MHEKIERYREKMIRDTIDLNLGHIDVINEINAYQTEKDALIQYCNEIIKDQLLKYRLMFDEFNVIQFVSKSERLYKLYKSLGDTKCETTKQTITIPANQIYP